MTWVRDLAPLQCAEANGQCEGTVALESDGTPRCRLHGRVRDEVQDALSRLRTLPKETEVPRLRSREEVVEYLEDRIHLTETGVLDPRVLNAVTKAVATALQAHELAALDRITKLEKVIRGRRIR